VFPLNKEDEMKAIRYLVEDDMGDLVSVYPDKISDWLKTQSDDPAVLAAKKAQREKSIAEVAEAFRNFETKT